MYGSRFERNGGCCVSQQRPGRGRFLVKVRAAPGKKEGKKLESNVAAKLTARELVS